jgi:hypothetical protein
MPPLLLKRIGSAAFEQACTCIVLRDAMTVSHQHLGSQSMAGVACCIIYHGEHPQQLASTAAVQRISTSASGVLRAARLRHVCCWWECNFGVASVSDMVFV